MRWTEYVAGFVEKINACKILVRNPEGKRQLTRETWIGKIILK
jgi:hypothetical protein